MLYFLNMRKGEIGRILITDDNRQLVELLSIKLSNLGYKVDASTSALKGFELAKKNTYDLIILDILMPKRTGLEICKDLRDLGIITPVLVLSGKTEKTSIVECLEAGADDYLTKPFNFSELVARVNAIMRRNKKTFSSRFVSQDEVELDITSHAVRTNHTSIQLTQTETELLQRLMHHAPETIPKEVLLEEVWGIDHSHSSNRLEVYIRRLRNKLKESSGSDYIHTNRGKGYYFSKT